MSWETGAETLIQRLDRLRGELVRVRLVIQRQEENGASWAVGGAQVSEIAYERALKRSRTLETEIAKLEQKMAGGAGKFATLKTVMP